MNQRAIPSTGEAIPVVGLGTYKGFDVGAGSPAYVPLGQVVDLLLDAGRGMIDSSPMYGRAEAVTGDLLARTGRRDGAFVATKVWTRGKKEGIAQMRRSLELLRTDRVDLMQVHNLVDADVHLDTLRGWKADGLTRYVGITHYQSGAFADLEAALRRHRLDFLQLNYSLEDRAAEERLLPLAQERGVAVIANVPFGAGALLARVAAEPLPPFAAEIGCHSWPQLLLKTVLGNPAITCAIPGTGNPAHMRDNLAAGAGDLEAARERILAWWRSR